MESALETSRFVTSLFSDRGAPHYQQKFNRGGTKKKFEATMRNTERKMISSQIYTGNRSFTTNTKTKKFKYLMESSLRTTKVQSLLVSPVQLSKQQRHISTTAGKKLDFNNHVQRITYNLPYPQKMIQEFINILKIINFFNL